METSRPVRLSAHGARSSLKVRSSVLAIASAPPDTRSSSPIIAPSPMTTAMYPSVLPMPSSMMPAMSASGMPPRMAASKLVRSSATKACTRPTSTRRSSTATASTTSPTRSRGDMEGKGRVKEAAQSPTYRMHRRDAQHAVKGTGAHLHPAPSRTHTESIVPTESVPIVIKSSVRNG